MKKILTAPGLHTDLVTAFQEEKNGNSFPVHSFPDIYSQKVPVKLRLQRNADKYYESPCSAFVMPNLEVFVEDCLATHFFHSAAALLFLSSSATIVKWLVPFHDFQDLRVHTPAVLPPHRHEACLPVYSVHTDQNIQGQQWVCRSTGFLASRHRHSLGQHTECQHPSHHHTKIQNIPLAEEFRSSSKAFRLGGGSNATNNAHCASLQIFSWQQAHANWGHSYEPLLKSKAVFPQKLAKRGTGALDDQCLRHRGTGAGSHGLMSQPLNNNSGRDEARSAFE